MSTEFRSRACIILGPIVVFGCFLVPSRQTASLALGWVSFFRPVQRVLARGARTFGLTLDGLASWRRAAEQNRRLHRQVSNLRARLEAERARSADKDRRLTLLSRFARHKQDLTSCDEAEVIGEGAGVQRGILFIDRGSRDGVETGMVVVAADSVVGRVRAVAASVSSVELVTSRGSRFDGQIVRTGEPGIVAGNGDGTMRMEYVSKTAPRPSDAVVTRGRDGITPRHFVLGIIRRAERRPGSTYDVVLRPVHDLRRLVSVVPVKPTIAAADFPASVPEGESPDG